jgi:hypothetical protein
MLWDLKRPGSLPWLLTGNASDRKMRLVACGFCRRIWDRLTDERSRAAVTAAEAHADSPIPRDLWWSIRGAALRALSCLDPATEIHARQAAQAAFDTTRDQACYAATHTMVSACRPVGDIYSDDAAVREEKLQQCHVIRDIFGNSAPPGAGEACDFGWNTSAVRRHAQRIYDNGAFDHLPDLAETLLEAGCSRSEIVTHCRQIGLHFRGCWVVDFILGYA